MYNIPNNGRTISGTGLDGTYNWESQTNPINVASGITNTNDLGYGIPHGGLLTSYPEPSTVLCTTVSDGYSNGVLHPNGKIYFIPDAETTIREFDPVTDTWTTFGTLSSVTGKWRGGCLAPNGMIYAAPNNATQWLKIDPYKRTATLVGAAVADTYSISIAGNDGFVYAIPNATSAGSVGVLDIYNETVSSFGNSGNRLYESASLGPDGRIYCIPFTNTTSVGIIDTVNRTYVSSAVATVPGSSNSHWFGGVMAPNGKIYFIPSSATNVLEYDTETGTSRSIGTVSSSTLKWRGGFLGPDGYIYGVPHTSTTILKIDPLYGTVEEFGSLSGSAKWAGGVMHRNGIAYCTTGRSDTVLKLDFRSQLTEKYTYSNEYNKL